MCPLFTGIGAAQVFVSSIVSIYYNVIIAWSLFYLVASFTTSLPWAKCYRSFASDCMKSLHSTTLKCKRVCCHDFKWLFQFVLTDRKGAWRCFLTHIRVFRGVEVRDKITTLKTRACVGAQSTVIPTRLALPIHTFLVHGVHD